MLLLNLVKLLRELQLHGGQLAAQPGQLLLQSSLAVLCCSWR
jgi:hypothetical protein